jgi:hypothetical protein
VYNSRTIAPINSESCDVWAYGMMVLKAGTLEDLQECYDKSNFDFRDHILEDHIRRFEIIYGAGSHLSKVVRACLSRVDQRPRAGVVRVMMPRDGDLSSSQRGV